MNTLTNYMKQDESLSLHLAFAFDRNYITPFYVLLTSIFHNNRSVKLSFHVIATDVSESDKIEIKDYVLSNHASIQFYDIKSEIEGVHFPKRFYFPDTTYYRLFFPSIVPEGIERLLFIDVDAIVVNSLSELFTLDLKSYPLGAVIEPDGEIRPELGVYEKYNYFNGGVLLFNIGAWKRQNILNKCIQFIRDYPERIRWVDQDVLNAVLVNNIYRLDHKYNHRSPFVPKDLRRKDIPSFIKDKVIFHYTGPVDKPWNGVCKNRLRFLYYHYFNLSPCAHERRYKDFKWTKTYLIPFFKYTVAQTLIEYPAVLKAWRRLKQYK